MRMIKDDTPVSLFATPVTSSVENVSFSLSHSQFTNGNSTGSQLLTCLPNGVVEKWLEPEDKRPPAEHGRRY
jgi:hypothetical protein